MKKMMMFAAMAMMTAVASAVSYSWTSTDGVFSGFKDDKGDVVTFKGDFKLSVSFIYDTAKTTVPDVYFKLNEGSFSGYNLTQGGFAITKNGDSKMDLHTYKGTATPVTSTTGGDISLGRLNGDSNGGTNTIKFIFSDYNETTGVYGSMKYAITFAGTGGAATNIVGERDVEGNPNGMTFGTDSIAWTYLMEGDGVTVTGMELEAVPVPEPTALALLALGVAGLALKRKMK